MNSKKHKNKKSKQQPQSKLSQNSAKTEDVTDSQIPCIENEIKDANIQEINTELTNPVENQENEVSVPKKPKRNKGKKKKQDKEDEGEKEQENVQSEPDKIEVVNIDVSENMNQNLSDITPVARKKKNKKGFDSSRDLKSAEVSEIIQLEEEVRNESKPAEKMPDGIQSLDEVKIAKKRNKKKKNRNDSEKSDKSGETASCTSAFQKLLDADEEEDMPLDEIKGPDTGISTENKSNISDVTDITLDSKVDENLLNPKVSVIVDNVETPKEADQEIDALHCFEVKNRKKNKKVKKEEHSDIIKQKKINEIEDHKKNIVERSEMALDRNKTEDDLKESLTSTFIKEVSPKPKAKIVKPVEKKLKGKQSLHEEISAFTFESEIKKEIDQDTFEDINVAKVLEKAIEPKGIKCDETQDDANQDQKSTTVLKDASDNASVNSKKKLDEIPESVNIVNDITEKTTSLQEDIKISTTDENQDAIKDDALFETLVPKDFESKVSDDKLNEILSAITETESNEFKKEDINDSDKLIEKNAKSRKKNRKVPKILMNPELSTAKESEILTQTENLKPNEDTNDYKCTLLTPSDDVDIGSAKADDSESSTCEVMPVILHPRSASEQLRDDNNNTIIREVFEDTLDVSLLTQTVPVIQGSGETPTETPECLSSGNTSVKIETILSKPVEKTDIKSKIIEVNKDMEELRLSIERSLAELSALEKTDENSENRNQEISCDKVDDKISLQKCDVTSKNIVSAGIEPNVGENQLAPKSQGTGFLDTDTTFIEGFYTEKILNNKTDQFQTKEIDEVDTFILDKTLIDQHKPENSACLDETPPVCPARREPKKGKKKKGRQDQSLSTNTPQSESSESTIQDTKKEEKSEEQTDATKENNNQQSTTYGDTKPIQDDEVNKSTAETDYEPIDNFEDALTSSADDINKTFEMIVNQITENSQQELASNKPEINITAPIEDTEQNDVKENPVTPPKNLLGHPNIPARSNKLDYKKVKDKTPNTKQAKVKIKDSEKIENSKESKESQTEKRTDSKRQAKLKNSESFCQISNCDNFIYKYSFRKVFLQSLCHICKKELIQFRVPCKFCSLLFYCSLKHKDEDWPQHQALCFAVSTIVHIKDQKHIYADAKNMSGHNYRLLRMQTILSCEKVLKRRLVPWEQELLLYPRICSEVSCREWRQSRLKDCEGCGQISYCSAHVEHLPKSHQRWCKSYALYQKLVLHQQTKGRLEPQLPTKVLKTNQIPEKINEVLASLFEEKIDLNDVQYAALTQIATAPLTVALSHQIYRSTANGITKDLNKVSACTIHVVGAELQFEADVLNKWEIFFLHLRPDIKDLRIVLISPDLNPGKLPLELLEKIRLCGDCCQNRRRVIFSFQDKQTYQDYINGDEFIYPDIVCAFNPNFHRTSYNGKDLWPSTITAVMKLKAPFVVTGHTITELRRDLMRVKEYAEPRVLVEPRPNPFSSVRPDRNFISDDECPLLFKNHCFTVLCGF